MADNTLWKMCDNKLFLPKYVVEVGVYLPKTSAILGFIRRGIKSSLVEAHPTYVNALQEYFSKQKNVEIFPVAVCDEEKKVKMYTRDASTFLSTLDVTPAKINDGYHCDEDDSFYVTGVTFDRLDNGEIDLLAIDIEGGEWFVIKHMKSRPTVLAVETHGKYYLNPYVEEIEQWVNEKGYKVWYKTKSDTVYADPKVIHITYFDKIRLFFKIISLAWRRSIIKKYLSDLLKKTHRL